MPATVSHALSMTSPDDPAYENKPSDWNSSHLFTLNAVGSEINNAFANGNGISFGLSAGSVSASHNALTSQSNQNVTADNGGFAFQTLSFSNVNGISFGTSAGSAITASHNGLTSQSNQAVSGQNGSSTFQTLSFGNANGVSFGTDAAGLTASHNGLTSQSNQAFSAANGSFTFQTAQFHNSNGVSWSTTTGSGIIATVATTYRASNDAVGLNTAQSNVTWTVNSAGISLDARGYAGTTTGFTGTNISATMTLNSAGLALQLSGGGGGVTNQTGPNIAAGTQTATSGTVVFSNSNNISFGMSDSSVVTASFNAINVGVSTDGNTAGTTGTIEGAGGQYLFVGTNGITLSQSMNGANSGTVTIVGNMISQRMQWPPGNFSVVAAMGNGSFSLNRMQNYVQLTATRMEVPVLVSIASSANANTWGFAATVFGAIYTKNVSTLSSLSSGSTSFSFSLASNSAGQTQVIAHAIRPFSLPININMRAGEYYIGMGVSTATSSAGTATTALGNTFSVMGGPIYSSAVGQVSEFTATTNTSTGIWGGQGIYSAAISTVPPTVSLSAINQTGSHYARANFAAIFRNI